MFANALSAAALISVLPLASAAVIDVFVGGTGLLAFNPPSVSANVGDSIRFTFGPKNHTVTQSTFASPCTQITDAAGNPAGFFSGYMPVAADQTEGLPEFWIPVKDTKPIWAFCSQTGHCGKGMVFAVNAPAAPAANSFEKYLALATGSGSPAVSSPVATTVAAAQTSAYSYGDAAYGDAGYGDAGYGSAATTVVESAVPTTQSTAVAAAATASSIPLAGAASGSGTVHVVTVGGAAGNVFTPSIITAAIGDTVMFQFQVKNHTVTQSTFKSPCSLEAGGFDSGFMPVATTDTTFPTYNVTVKDTAPIWGYCRQATHCSTGGMVFAINSNETTGATNNFAAFQAAAKSSGTASASAATASATGTANGALGAVVAHSKMVLATMVLVTAGFSILL